MTKTKKMTKISGSTQTSVRSSTPSARTSGSPPKITPTTKKITIIQKLYQQIYNAIPKTFDDAQRERERERENQFRAREAATRWYVW